MSCDDKKKHKECNEHHEDYCSEHYNNQAEEAYMPMQMPCMMKHMMGPMMRPMVMCHYHYIMRPIVHQFRPCPMPYPQMPEMIMPTMGMPQIPLTPQPMPMPMPMMPPTPQPMPMPMMPPTPQPMPMPMMPPTPQPMPMPIMPPTPQPIPMPIMPPTPQPTPMPYLPPTTPTIPPTMMPATPPATTVTPPTAVAPIMAGPEETMIPVTQPGCEWYIVKKGDSMYKIAQKYNISLDQLIAANPQISNPALIYPGQQICIPTNSNMGGTVSGNANCTWHTVKKGDSMWSIAKKHNISLNQLIAANPQIQNPELIYPGQKICIPRRRDTL